MHRKKPITDAEAIKATYERMEQHVEEKELRNKGITVPASPELSPELEAKIDAFAANVRLALHRAVLLFQHCKGALTVSDRSVSRAFIRLCKQVSEAHEASEAAESHHATIERMCAPVHLRVAASDSNDDASIAELTNAMIVLRRKNFFIADALFRIDRIVRRLHVLKLLLEALPGNMRDELLQFRNALNAVSNYVNAVCSTNEEPSANDLLHRIELLEQRTVLVYIRIAKDKNLRRAARQRMMHNLNKLTPFLDAQIGAEQLLYNEWKERALTAEIDGQKLVAAVSELRTEQCAIVVKSLQRTHKVLDAVREALSEPAETIPSKRA